MVRVRGAGGGRVSIAGMACYRPGDRPHLCCQLLVYRRKGEPKGFTCQDYRDLIIAARRQQSAPLVWCWEGIWSLLKRSMASFTAADLDGLVRIIKRKLKKIQQKEPIHGTIRPGWTGRRRSRPTHRQPAVAGAAVAAQPLPRGAGRE